VSPSTEKVQLAIKKNRRQVSPEVKLNQESVKKGSDYAVVMPTVVLEPGGVSLIEGSPGVRRKWVDMALFHVEHSFLNSWKRYSQGLEQRNALVKKFSYDLQSTQATQFDAWENEMVVAADQIDQMREKVLSDLQAITNNLISSYFNNILEPISLNYRPGNYLGELYRDQLIRTRGRDLAVGYTQHGPHRSEIEIKSNHLLVRDYFSRGQKKLITYALRFALAELMSHTEWARPTILIDDLISELDPDSSKVLASYLTQWRLGQLFITSTSNGEIAKELIDALNPRMFHVEHGKFTECL
jgi:DNA replication and repair protein RecF